MFGLSFVDHLRLTFGHVIFSQKTHAQSAIWHARNDRWLKAAEALLMLLTAVGAIALAQTLNPLYAYLAAVSATLAILVLVVRLAVDSERLSRIHRVCAGELWHIRERYRALLADLHDGVLTPEAARERRDALMTAVGRIYEHAPPMDRDEYARAKASLGSADETALSDEEIDRFLPPSLRRAHSGDAQVERA